MLEAPRGFLAVFGGGRIDPEKLTRDFGKEWDIVTHMAIKLVPGAHAFHPAVEAASTACHPAFADTRTANFKRSALIIRVVC
jgi:hypothetical protein